MCWNCRNSTGRPHVGGRGRLPKKERERIERQVSERIAAQTKTFNCVICGQPYQEATPDGEQYDGMCNHCPVGVERTPEQKAEIQARLDSLAIKRQSKWAAFEREYKI